MEIKPTSPREAVVCSQNWACLSESRWNAEMDTKVEQHPDQPSAPPLMQRGDWGLVERRGQSLLENGRRRHGERVPTRGPMCVLGSSLWPGVPLRGPPC